MSAMYDLAKQSLLLAESEHRLRQYIRPAEDCVGGRWIYGQLCH